LWMGYIGVLIVDSLMWMQKTFICNRFCLVVVVPALDGSRVGVHSSLVMLLIVEVHVCIHGLVFFASVVVNENSLVSPLCPVFDPRA
jgi:hypothetical protein